MPVCVEKEKVAKPVPTKAFLQAAKAASMFSPALLEISVYKSVCRSLMLA